MADNIILPTAGTGTTTPTIATDDVGGAHYQRIKVVDGTDGSATYAAKVDSTGSLNVSLALSDIYDAEHNTLRVEYGDPSMRDAFGRLRVSNPITLWESKLIFDSQDLQWDDAATSGAGTGTSHSADAAAVTLSVSNATAGVRVRQSKRRFNYQPGKSQLAFLTFVFGAAGTGLTRRVGLFDAQNGVFLEQTSTALKFVVRSYTGGSASDANFAAQADWNLDTLDGNGPSGIALNLEKPQIMFVQYEWLGVGSVWCGFVIDGAYRYCHRFDWANEQTGTVYMTTPNLPIRYELSNGGTGAAATLKCICSTVISEGGSESTGFERAIDRGVTAITTLNDGDIYPVVAIRLKSTHLGAKVQILKAHLLNTSTAIYRWALLLNPTVAGTALSFSDVTNSALQAAVGATNATKVSGGTVVASGYDATSTTASLPSESGPGNLEIGATIAGTADVLVLAVQRITGTTETFYGGLQLRETY